MRMDEKFVLIRKKMMEIKSSLGELQLLVIISSEPSSICTTTDVFAFFLFASPMVKERNTKKVERRGLQIVD